MNVLVYYTNNIVKLNHILQRACSADGVQTHCVKGSMLRGSDETKAVGSIIEILAFVEESKDTILVTNNPEFAYASQHIDYNPVERQESFYSQILQLCEDKFKTSKNIFHIEFAGPGCTLEAKVLDNGKTVEYTARAPRGDLVIDPGKYPHDIMSACDKIRTFSYTVNTQSCARSVTVSKGQLEIMREISHYCNKSLILTKLGDAGLVNEYCISNNGCCIALPATDVYPAKVKRIPFTRMTIDDSCSVYATTASFDHLLKERKFSDAMSGKAVL